MLLWLDNLPSLISFLLIFITCNCLSLLGYAISQQIVDKVDHRDVVTKVVWQTILFFMTLFITFWIATNWSNLGALREVTVREANSITQIYNELDMLAEPGRSELQFQLKNYLDSVIHSEYSYLEQGQLSPKTNHDYRNFILAVYSFHPQNNLRSELCYRRVLALLNEFSNYREGRLAYLAGNLHGPLLLFFLMMIVLGCFWTGFIHTRSFLFTLFIIMSQNLIISSSSWLILSMDKPFQGEISIDNSPFIASQNDLDFFAKRHKSAK